ncbi:hypothetical protein BT69DRAFT_1286396, partial [Atractiella rhizophila]
MTDSTDREGTSLLTFAAEATKQESSAREVRDAKGDAGAHLNTPLRPIPLSRNLRVGSLATASLSPHLCALATHHPPLL